jgi:hypothetical protein
MPEAFEETSGHVRPERVNKWPNSMTGIIIIIIVMVTTTTIPEVHTYLQ